MAQRLAMSEDQADRDDHTDPGTGQAQNHFDVVTDMIAWFTMTRLISRRGKTGKNEAGTWSHPNRPVAFLQVPSIKDPYDDDVGLKWKILRRWRSSQAQNLESLWG